MTVFISYATENRPVATAACQSLEEDGFPCWIAPRDVIPGELWPVAITSAIERSDLMVVVLSSAAIGSDDVLREITLAAEEQVAILPYRIEDAPHTGAFKFFLNSRHWLNAFPDPLSEEHLAALKEALRRSRAGAPELVPADSPVAMVPPPPPDRRVALRTAAMVAAGALIAGPLALLLSSPLEGKPEARGAHTFLDLAEARERVAYYALERGIIWAVIGAVILMAWIWASRTRRPIVPSAIGAAFAGALGGALGGVIYQGGKYLANERLPNERELPDELVLRGSSYAIAGAFIGFTFARAAAPLARSEGVVAGAAAGVLAAWVTAQDLDTKADRYLSIALEAAILGGVLALAGAAASRRVPEKPPA